VHLRGKWNGGGRKKSLCVLEYGCGRGNEEQNTATAKVKKVLQKKSSGSAPQHEKRGYGQGRERNPLA